MGMLHSPTTEPTPVELRSRFRQHSTFTFIPLQSTQRVHNRAISRRLLIANTWSAPRLDGFPDHQGKQYRDYRVYMWA